MRSENSSNGETTLQILREVAGYTQETFSRELGLSKSTIGFYESGQKLPRVDRFLSMCRVLGVSPKTLARAMRLDVSGIADDAPPSEDRE